ncbi:hypothetical protein [Streptomyces sp. NPDC010273]|uniref:hypothetical protein n=1 Tax=Streptomyces sp. NPDC010273 TaxID=3364829 RepID=UPI0036F0ECCB
MDWWDQVGNMVSFFGDTPALAVDMALNGPESNHVGYGLAYGLQMAQTPIDVYPSEGSFADAEG